MANDPFDPFANNTEKNTEENNVSESPFSEPTVDQNGTEVTLTWKQASGYDAPWIVIRAASLERAKEIVTDEAELLKEVMDGTAKAAGYFLTTAPERPKNTGGSAPASNAGGSSRTAAPNGQTRDCKHGAMTYKSGSKNGRTWEAFFCPTPKDTADQCKPVFL